MSADISHKRRCVIKKLDFENCVVTNIRTKARGRRKLRARVTQEIGHFGGGVEEKRDEEINRSPVLSQKIRKVSRKGKSPVLMTKSKGNGSPILFSKRKLNFGESSQCVPSDTQNESRATSPIFKFTNSKLLNVSFCQGDHQGRKIPRFRSEESTSSEKCQSSYQIDSFSQESKQTFEISSVDSENIKNVSSSDQSVSTNNNFLAKDSLQSLVCKTKETEVSESPNVKMETVDSLRKNYKKNSILGRLQKVLRKQASEKLLWQHQKQKNFVSNVQKFAVVSFWNVNYNFILKCESLPDSEISFLVVDCRWVPNIKNIKMGTVLQLYPPRQKLTFGDPPTNVFINIICIEILHEHHKPKPKETYSYESVPVDEFQHGQNTFIDSFFSSHLSSFLY